MIQNVRPAAATFLVKLFGQPAENRLGVRPKSSRGFVGPLEYQLHGRGAEKRRRGPVEILEMLHYAHALSEPAKTTFDDPSFR